MKLHLPLILRKAVLAAFLSVPIWTVTTLCASYSTVSAYAVTVTTIESNATWDNTGPKEGYYSLTKNAVLTVTGSCSLSSPYEDSTYPLVTAAGTRLAIGNDATFTLNAGGEINGEVTGGGLWVVGTQSDSLVTFSGTTVSDGTLRVIQRGGAVRYQ